jgi:hypothetical protein
MKTTKARSSEFMEVLMKQWGFSLSLFPQNFVINLNVIIVALIFIQNDSNLRCLYKKR